MEELLIRTMEFLIELAVPTSALTVVVVGLSILFLHGSNKSVKASILTPALLSILVGALGPEDHTSLRQWAYYVLPTLVLSTMLVSLYCHSKRKPGR